MCRKNVLTIVAVAMLVLAFGQGQVAWGGITQLSDAMGELTDHINNTTPLTGPQLEAVTATIEANKAFMDDDTTIMTEAFVLSSLYETVVGPLFINAETTNGFPRVQGGSDGYELERAIFSVQQAILDVVYSPANCQTYQSLFDGKILETSDFFPGACTPPVDPEVSYDVDINGTNPEMWGKPVCFGPIPARRPTGVYLAPGSIGEVTVPSAIVNQGFEILVGAHTVDKFANYKPTHLRLDRVSKSFPITSTVTNIANPLGGGIYIIVPYEANFGIRTVSIKNVVPSPFFSATSTNQTTLQQWTDTERNHPGPWADFESDKFMMNIPTSWIYNYADPVTQMQDWDLAMDGFSELLGRTDPHNIRNLVVLYVQPDVSIQHGAYGTGYPQVNTIYNPNNSTNGNQNHFLLRDVLGWETTYHEAGHCQQMSMFPGHTEAIVNLPYMYIGSEYFGMSLIDAFTGSMELAYLENVDVDQAALMWFVTENFRNGNPMDITPSEYNEVRYQHRAYGRYVDISELFGWNVIINFYYQEHLDYISGAPGDGLSSVDSRIFRLSKAAGQDLTPLIHCWGVHPVDLTALKTAIATEGLPSSQIVQDRLTYYKSIIPANNAEFWNHYTTVYPSQPSGGNPLYQYGWYNVWKSIYDTDEGTAAKDAMQVIIDLHYGVDVVPPTPSPATFSLAPSGISDSQITMTATIGMDATGPIEYFFDETSGNPGGTDSGWITNTSYTDTELDTDTEYTYTVQMRDAVTPTPYVGTTSDPESARTHLTGGTLIAIPNSDFETMYKPGSTTITATLTGWTQGVGPDCPIDNGQYDFSDQTSGTLADIPEWLGYDRDGWVALGGTYDRDQTTGHLQGSISTGGNHTPGGAYSYLVNGGGWGNPAGGLIVSESSFGTIQSDYTYELSIYAYTGGATPVALKLLANGTELTPTLSVDPTTGEGHQLYSRRYDYTVLTSYVGQAMTVVCGVERNCIGAQTRMDDISLKYWDYSGSDTDPPTPDPATFASAPAAVSDTEITMTATTGSDASGPVEYYFDETSGNPGGTDSGWTTNPVYNNTGLTASTQYTYTVQMRDSVTPTPNVGTVSAPANATTDPPPSGDTVVITKAEYKSSRSEINVEATSSDGGSVTLTVVGYGDMTYDSRKNKFKYKVRPVADPGATVTVTSSGGGQDTANVTQK